MQVLLKHSNLSVLSNPGDNLKSCFIHADVSQYDNTSNTLAIPFATYLNILAFEYRLCFRMSLKYFI